MSKLSDTELEVTNLVLCVETHRNKSIGTLMRCAVAFGASIIVIVGSPKFSTHGAYEAKKFIRVIHFFYWKDCIAFVKGKGFSVYGISPRSLMPSSLGNQTLGIQSDSESDSASELVAGEGGELSVELKGEGLSIPSAAVANVSAVSVSVGSVPVEDMTFDNSLVAFIVGEKEGLTAEQLSLCDTVLHVGFPHPELEEYVHYDSKIAICFSHHASSAGFSQRERQGEKYTLREVNSSFSDGLKACRIDEKPCAVDSEDGLLNLFGDD